MADNKLICANYAAIDVGTNAVRLLIKHIEEQERKTVFTKELLVRIPMRLGFDVFDTGYISEVKAKKMVRLMKAYSQMMKLYDVADYRACATSALRDAQNGKQLVKQIAEKTGIRIEIISGQEEATIIYNNHVEQMKDRSGNYMYVDVGGGSTEINLLSDGKLVCSRSYNIGTIRLLNNAVGSETWEKLVSDMKEIASKYPGTEIIGSGGNINKYYKLVDRSKEDTANQRIQTEALKEVYEKLCGMTVEQRMQAYKLKPDRADVIVPAGKIFVTIADIIGARFIYVPVIGLSDGIIDSLYVKNKRN